MPALAAAFIGGSIASSGAKSAARTQAAATERATQLQLEGQREGLEFQRDVFEREFARDQPLVAARDVSLERLRGILGLGPGVTIDGATGEVMPEESFISEGQQRELETARRGLEASAAARGETFSGNTLLDIARQSRGAESTARTGRINELLALAGFGQRGAGSQAGAAASIAGRFGDVGRTAGAGAERVGDIRASGTVGRTNIQTNLLSQLAQGFGQLPGQQPVTQQTIGPSITPGPIRSSVGLQLAPQGQVGGLLPGFLR